MSGEPGGKIETERKYQATPDFAVPDLSRLPGVSEVTSPVTHRLTAVYFDTADLRLVDAHVTLRRRTGGTDAGWHLKLPAGADTRQEVHAPLGTPPDPVPGRLAGLASRWSGDRALAPIARLETTRTVRSVLGAAGQELAEVADDRVTGSLPAAGHHEWAVASSWREIEVELGDGPPRILDEVEILLLRAGARLSGSASKLARLLAASGPAAPGPH
jgi:inorganic triphosphatase YgiF